MLRAYTYKFFRSPLFYVGILGVFFLCFTEFIDNDFDGTVMYHIDIFLYLGQYRKALAVFAALPFAANFADEWISGTTKECVVRVGIKKYAMTNLLFCWLSAILTVFLGMMLFTLTCSFIIPVSEPYTNPNYFLFAQFLYKQQGEIYIVLKVLIFAVSCGMWSVMGMLLSVFFPNKFVAICTPFVASYAVERITEQWSGNLNLYYVSLGVLLYDDFGSDLLGFLYCVGLFTAWAAILGIIFYVFLKKKVQNGIT